MLLLAAVVVLALVAGAAVRWRVPGPPATLVAALEVMPLEAAQRGLYYTAQAGTLDSLYGLAPGQVEPAVTDAYAIRGEDITAVLESGGPASTVLLGRFPADDIAAAFERLGYDRSSRDGWTVLTASSGAEGPLAAGAQTVALRPDAIVLSTTAELAALGQGSSADTAPWVAGLLRAVPGDATAVALGPAYDEMAGDKVAPPGPQGGPSNDAAWMIAFPGTGEERRGVVSLLYAQPAGPAAAGELAGRIAASGRVGLGADILVVEPGEPRWDAEHALATVPVTATASARTWEHLRRSIEAGEAGFLRQP